MIVRGEHGLLASAELVWRALHDVGVLRATVPGCEELDQTGPDEFTGAASVGIAIIKGLYRGKLKLLEEQEPSFISVQVEARSGHAEIRGKGSLHIEPAGDATLLRYEGEARISGPLASVGQRLLPSASKALIEQFFRNLDDWLVAGLDREEEATA